MYVSVASNGVVIYRGARGFVQLFSDTVLTSRQHSPCRRGIRGMRQLPAAARIAFACYKLANWQVYWQLRYGYTAKGHQYQAAGGRPVFCFLGVFLALLGSSSLRSRWVSGHRAFYVVPTAAVHVAVCKVLGKL